MGFIKRPQFYAAEAKKIKGGNFNDRKCIKKIKCCDYDTWFFKIIRSDWKRIIRGKHSTYHFLFICNEEIFLQSLLKFIEYNGKHVYDRIKYIHKDDFLIILHCLNRFIIANLQGENPDIRLLNAVIKYTPSKFFNDYSYQYSQICKKFFKQNLLSKNNEQWKF